VTGAGVAVHAIERAVLAPGRVGDGVDEALVAAHAVHADHLASRGVISIGSLKFCKVNAAE